MEMDSEWTRIAKFLMAPIVLLVPLAALPVLAKTFSGLINPDSAHSTPTPTPAPGISHPTPAPPVADNPTDWTTAVTIGAIVFAIVIAIAAGIIFVVWMSRHREHTRQRAARRETQRNRWAKAVNNFNEICAALAEFETDPESVYFTRPLLADVTEPASAAFYTALGAAQDLHTETVPVDDPTITEFAAAVAAARTAFDIADANARRKARNGIVRGERGDRALSLVERRKVGQAQKLMAQAVDASSTPQFARTAHDKALSLLAEVGIDIPQRLVTKVTDALETTRRLALTRN